MDVISVAIGLCNVACGLVFVLVGAVLVLFRIPFKCWFGFHVPGALSSEENWRLANRFGGKRLVVWGIPLTMTGVICALLAFPPPNSWMAPLGLLPIFAFLLIPIIETAFYAGRLPSQDADEATIATHAPVATQAQ